MKYVGIIPARYASSRFPGKPLCDLLGKSMIQRVYESALKWQQWHYLCIATDSQLIHDTCIELSIPCVMTRSDHVDCIDRCYEAAINLESGGIEGDRYIIIQGDEPLFNASTLDVDLTPDMVNFYTRVALEAEIGDRNCVKVVVSSKQKAIYFSRHTIPYSDKAVSRGDDEGICYKQLGIYSMSLDKLKLFHDLEPSFLEKREGIGLLRLIENDVDVNMRYTEHDSISIDTPEDRDKVLGILKAAS